MFRFIIVSILFFFGCTHESSNIQPLLTKFAEDKGYKLQLSGSTLPQTFLSLPANNRVEDLFPILKDYLMIHDLSLEVDASNAVVRVRDVGHFKRQWHQDFDKAKAQAKRQKKPLLVKFDADWCKPCKLMTAEFLESKNEEVYQRFVLASIDVSDDTNLLNEIAGKVSLPAMAAFAAGDYSKPLWYQFGYNPKGSLAKLVIGKTFSLADNVKKGSKDTKKK